MANLIISPNAKFGGKTLEQIAKEERKQETKTAPQTFQRQNVLPGDIIALASYGGSKGKTQEEAVKEANEKKLIIANNLWADKDLNQDGGYSQRSGTYPIWTGTMVAYEKPGVAFKDKIVCTDSETSIAYVFEVPFQFKGKTNCILCIDHGFLDDGKQIFEHVKLTTPQGDPPGVLIKVADLSLVKCIENYNKADGWYVPEKEFGIPVGSKSKDSVPDARYSWRINDGSYVGLVARGYDVVDGLRDVGAGGRPSVRLGVLAYSEQV